MSWRAGDRYLWCLASLVPILLLDQAIKGWVRNRVDLWGLLDLAQVWGGSGAAIQAFGVSLVHIHNSGGAFGLAHSAPVLFFLGAGGGVLVALMAHMRQINDLQRAMAGAIGLIAGGTLGNLIDRVSVGVVTDFVHLGLSARWGVHLPVFNLADMAILIGVAVITMIWLVEGVGASPPPPKPVRVTAPISPER